MEEPIIIGKIKKRNLFKVDVTKFKTYIGSFPVIKPTKKMTEKEIQELLKKPK